MAIHKEKLLERRTMYEGKMLHVYFDRVILAGRQVRREIVLHPGASAIIPITEDGQVIFVKQYRYVIRKELLELPAGKMNPGEDPAVCAARELEEETGYAGTLKHLGDIYTSPGYSNEKIHLYLADHLVYSAPHPDEGEYLDVVKIPLADVWKEIRDGHIEDAKTLSAFALAHPYLCKDEH